MISYFTERCQESSPFIQVTVVLDCSGCNEDEELDKDIFKKD